MHLKEIISLEKMNFYSKHPISQASCPKNHPFFEKTALIHTHLDKKHIIFPEMCYFCA
jgi:hypothetical protein